MLAMSLLLSIFLVGENLRAEWRIIDDHEIAAFLGSDHLLRVQELPSVMGITDFARFKEIMRFRPAYYPLRIAEVILWGANPHLWYASRMILFALFIFLLWWMTADAIGVLGGVIFTMFILASHYWSKIILYISGAEPYACVGTALFFWSFFRLCRPIKWEKTTEARTTHWWILLSIGGFIAAGSKENFVPLILLPILALLAISIHRKALRLIPFLSIVFLLSTITTIIGFVGYATLRSGHDVYFRSTSLTARLPIALGSISYTVNNLHILPILVIAIILSVFAYCRTRDWRKTFMPWRHYWLFLIYLIVIYASQYVYYNGDIPLGSRYAFPAVLCQEIFWLVCFLLGSELLTIARLHQVALLCIRTVFLVIITAGIVMQGGLFTIRRAAHENLLRTQTFAQEITVLRTLVALTPTLPIILEPAYCFSHYEPPFSVARFLLFEHVQNPIYLTMKEDMKERDSLLGGPLCRQLQYYSREGRLEHGYNIHPLREFHGGDCVSIVFNNAVPQTCKCSFSITI